MGNAVVLKRHYSNSLSFDSNEDMRGDLIRYRPESLDSLVEQTKFTRKEIQLMYRGFKQRLQGCPRGVVSMEQFREIYLQFFPHDSSSYSTFVFNTFDIDGNGTISFREFAVGLSVLSKGTIEEKLKWIFKLYDTDDQGYFTKDDLRVVLTSIYGLMGKIDEYQREKIEDHVEEIFYKMDENHDGLITESEFLKYCSENQDVVSSIALFGTIF